MHFSLAQTHKAQSTIASGTKRLRHAGTPPALTCMQTRRNVALNNMACFENGLMRQC